MLWAKHVFLLMRPFSWCIKRSCVISIIREILDEIMTKDLTHRHGIGINYQNYGI